MSAPLIEVRGGATAAELAVVLATLGRIGGPSAVALSPYERWRKGRIAVVRPT
jgi:hypothetical protein